ncbi:MAG: efflux RND transporter periplasmic adaptor subunit [Myxococcales bacterium]|nr:efflux RND transporter periplasmic adaptor subunit [Myxococcales bacterium]
MKYRPMLGLVGLLLGCPRAPEAPAPEATREGPLRVTVSAEGYGALGLVIAPVTLDGFVQSLRLFGQIESDPRHFARVGTRSGGRVLAINVEVGQRVRVGDPLVEVDTTELHQVTLEYLTATARLRQAEDRVARQRALGAERIGAAQELAAAEAELAMARAAFAEGEEHLHFLGLREADIARLRSNTSHGESRSIIRSPVAGRVQHIDVTVGQNVGGEATLVEVGNIDRLWAVLEVSERNLADVRPGATLTLEAPGGALREQSTVSTVADMVDRSTRTVSVRAPLRNPEGRWRPGMSLIGTLALPRRAGSLWLPREAVQRVAGRRVVFVSLGARSFEARPVEVGEESTSQVEIRSGLGVGTPTVVEGAFSLRAVFERDSLGEED